MKQAVQRGLDRREPDAVAHLGLDEKSFKRGHRYITLLNDLDDGRVLDVVEERTIEATAKLLQTLTEEQQKHVKSVSLDMWQALQQSFRRNFLTPILSTTDFPCQQIFE